jgi:hypothetical protein
VALAVYWLLSGRSRELPWRRLLAVAGLIALGVGLNGWFLLPDISYAHDTMIGGEYVPWSHMDVFNTFGVIFDPLRTVPPHTTFPALYAQAPVLALLWGLLAAPLSWRYRGLRAGVATALIVLAGVLVVMMSQAAWESLPNLYQRAQFAYRLQTYVTLAIAGLVLVGALALTRRARSGRATRADRPLALGLGLVVAFSVVLCAWQLWVPNTHVNERPAGGLAFSSYANRGDVLRGPPILAPESWNAKNDYGDGSLPVLGTRAQFWFDPTQVEDDRFAGPVSVPAGLQPFATNIAGGPYLVHVGGGVRVAGRTPLGNLVLKRTTDGSQPVSVELSPHVGAPVVLGRITTGISAVLLLALAGIAIRRRRRRRAAFPAGTADASRELGTSPST